MYAPFMVVNHAWRRLLAQGGDPKSTAFPARGEGDPGTAAELSELAHMGEKSW